MLDKIKALCKEKKTSVAKLEKQLGFGNGVIGRWDKSVPSYERLAAVASALDVSVAYLTGETDDPSAGIKEERPADGEALTEKQKEAVEFIKTLSDDDLGWFIAGAKAMQERKNKSE